MGPPPEWDKVKPIDVFLIDEPLPAPNIGESEAEIIIPLHLNMLSHRWHLRTMEREQHHVFIEKVENTELSPNTKVIPLLWGESTIIEK